MFLKLYDLRISNYAGAIFFHSTQLKEQSWKFETNVIWANFY
jgi:hypothetical protein